MAELKPCPFCGGAKLQTTVEDDYYKLVGRYGSACVSITCPKCKTIMYDHSSWERNYEKRIEILTNKWNRRASDE